MSQPAPAAYHEGVSPLPTVLLRHQTRHGQHYDWLLCDPRDPAGPLPTFRVAQPTAMWATLRCVDLEPIAAHRRVYLAYEGNISGGRGQVRRVDQGVFTPVMWTASRIVIDLRTRCLTSRIEMRRVSSALWRARVEPSPRCPFGEPADCVIIEP